ncbi:MAG: oxidative damage protection protein [Gemmatimonadetes bacterium]|nr:oxidative damage protection protein [Gemmatimonadota bacterium]MCB9504657.1 oxidative damage protection protein [Gemmatimonadales bacterium]MCA9763265.1 oxidative damage protection protein [Gemmatimonadota bacterium]MCA9767376.1 oxidative damage protection protein [Gemmatimonadota bacterium]HPF61081.1 oxidative damage protection protein [Gemmatimonadales bacterium]
MTTLTCARCGKTGERQAFKPFQNELGQRIYDSICRECWADWLRTQQQLINHYALVPHQPQAKAFLLKNLEQFCFGEGAPDSIP